MKVNRTAIETILENKPTETSCAPALEWNETRQNFFERKYKLERLAGCISLVATSPIILGLWTIVKLTSKGPGFYRQVRVGRDGQVFEIVKLRTMTLDAEANGSAVWCKPGDARITPVGNWLRKLHLDELPQFYNVARGEMGLIGPRPERPEIVCELEKQIAGYQQRHATKPGISGLAQINLPPDRTLDDVRRKQILDLTYINQTNLWLECKILLASALRLIGLSGETIIKWTSLDHRHLLKADPKIATTNVAKTHTPGEGGEAESTKLKAPHFNERPVEPAQAAPKRPLGLFPAVGPTNLPTTNTNQTN